MESTVVIARDRESYPLLSESQIFPTYYNASIQYCDGGWLYAKLIIYANEYRRINCNSIATERDDNLEFAIRNIYLQTVNAETSKSVPVAFSTSEVYAVSLYEWLLSKLGKTFYCDELLESKYNLEPKIVVYWLDERDNYSIILYEFETLTNMLESMKSLIQMMRHECIAFMTMYVITYIENKYMQNTPIEYVNLFVVMLANNYHAGDVNMATSHMISILNGIKIAVANNDYCADKDHAIRRFDQFIARLTA